ncbi:MAG TPA: class I SAM-dependent methyltransferase [Thermoanaerobaculia bacterium]|nr:class I SAM-dependent methyltransferase [Thermoanaerobaculia bacterium]
MTDERFIESPPQGTEGWRDVWRRNLKYRPAKSPTFFRRLFDRLAGPLVRRSISLELDRQRDYNLAVLDLLDGVQLSITSVAADIAALQGGLTRDLRAVSGELMNVIAVAEKGLQADLKRVEALLPVAVQRNDALFAVIDRKVEALTARFRDVVNPFASSAGIAAPQSLRDDFVYRRFEDAMRGSEGEIRRSVEHYAKYAEANQPVLDLGCGRGEFLEVCRAREVKASGIDGNERSVADLKARGIEVTWGFVPQALRLLPANSLGSIFAAHLVEHLPFSELVALFQESARLLRAGGLLMIETPNAESMAVGATDFWRDPTHLAPRHPAALVSMARELGFSIAEITTSDPLPDAEKVDLSGIEEGEVLKLGRRVNARLFGDQNLRLVLRKD